MPQGEKFTDIDLSDMDAPICNQCKHFNRVSLNMICTAYPKGIPIQIIKSIVDHKTPFINDNGVRFEPI